MVPHYIIFFDSTTWRQQVPMPSRRRRGFLLSCGWLLCMGTAAMGCSQRTNRYPVEGMLTIDGKPSPQGMQIVFSPQEPEVVPEGLQSEAFTGVTNDQGRYVAYYRPGMKGLPAGRYVVSIVSPADEAAGTMIVPPWLAGIKIPSHYRIGRSTLTCVVRPGGTAFDLDVRTK